MVDGEEKRIAARLSDCWRKLQEFFGLRESRSAEGRVHQADPPEEGEVEPLQNTENHNTKHKLNPDSDATKLALHLFRWIFVTVTKTPSDFERFLEEPLTLECKADPEPSTPFLVPCDKFINLAVAAVIQRIHGMDIYYRKQALKFLRLCLVSQLNLPGCVTDVSTLLMAEKSASSDSDLNVQMIRAMSRCGFLRQLLVFLLLLSSQTSLCSAVADYVEPLLIVDRAGKTFLIDQSGKVIYAFSSLWLLSAFVLMAALLGFFFKFLCTPSVPPTQQAPINLNVSEGLELSTVLVPPEDDTRDSKPKKKKKLVESGDYGITTYACDKILGFRDDDTIVRANINNDLIATTKGSNGSVVVEGICGLRGLEAVKCVDRSQEAEIDNEVKGLRISDEHPNIIRLLL